MGFAGQVFAARVAVGLAMPSPKAFSQAGATIGGFASKMYNRLNKQGAQAAQRNLKSAQQNLSNAKSQLEKHSKSQSSFMEKSAKTSVARLQGAYKKLGKSLSQIVNNFSDTPAIIEGELNISNGKIHTTDLHVKNNNNRINLKGSYDIPSDFFDAQIFFFETENLIVEAVISGSLQNPSIQIINENNLIDDTQINNDLKKVFEDGINTLIDKLLNLNE